MNTDNANKYLDERQIYQRDVWDSKDIEHPLDCLLEDYHQEQLKLLGIAVVRSRLKMGAKVYKKDKTITGFIDRKADRGFNHWIVIWNDGEQTKEYGSDLNVC